MSDYRNYQTVVSVKHGHNPRRMFIKLSCGHEVYRYGKAEPKKVLCEHCNRSKWFSKRRT